MRLLTGAALLMLSAPLCGCNVDLGLACRTVAGIYCLDKWEDGQSYYLNDRRGYGLGGGGKDGGGVIDGTVQQIGWTDRVILVDRQAIWGGDPNGWMVIDVRQRIVRGPI